MSLSVKLATIPKYLDQPALMNKLNNLTPKLLVACGAGYCGYETFKAEKSERKNKFIQSASVMGFTIASALLATKGLKIKGKQIFKGLIEHPHIHKHDIDEVLAKVSDAKILKYINKVKDDKILKLNEVRALAYHFKESLGDADIMKKVIPDAHNHGAFEELKDLSILGLVPVVGGIAGGVVGDVLTNNNNKRNFSNKVKEGSYQYLNNIFLCNVGAGISMVLMNKLGVKSKATRFAAMLAGVVGVGLVAGSLIANFIGKKIINPLFDNNDVVQAKNIKNSLNLKELNNERHPEALDASLHIDDIASVGFLSGFKWIAPILPVLYSVSGYRAGIGYRNGEHSEKLSKKDD